MLFYNHLNSLSLSHTHTHTPIAASEGGANVFEVSYFKGNSIFLYNSNHSIYNKTLTSHCETYS